MDEVEQLKSSRGSPAKATKGRRGRSASEPENMIISVLDAKEQIAPILIKTMTTLPLQVRTTCYVTHVTKN